MAEADLNPGHLAAGHALNMLSAAYAMWGVCVCVCVCVCVHARARPRAQSCLTLCDPTHCNLPGSSAPPILSTYCVPDSVQVPSSSYFQRSEEKRASQPSPGVLGAPGAIRFSCIPHSGCLRHSWEQMLGPEVKRSWLMIDDADLQPQLVRSGERTNSQPYGIPTPAAPYDNGGSLLPAHCLSTCSTCLVHTQSPTVYLPSGGWTGRHLNWAGQRQGKVWTEESRTEG